VQEAHNTAPGARPPLPMSVYNVGYQRLYYPPSVAELLKASSSSFQSVERADPIVASIEFIFACDAKIATDTERPASRAARAFSLSLWPEPRSELNSLFNQRMPSASAAAREICQLRRRRGVRGPATPAFNRRWPRSVGPAAAADEFTSLPAAHASSSAANRIDSFITSYVCPVGRRSRLVRCFNIDCICHDAVGAMVARLRCGR